MRRSLCFIGAALILIAPCICFYASGAQTTEDLVVLSNIIAQYNLRAIEKSLDQETYKGEAGILRVRPEVGKDLGFRTMITEGYQRAQDLMEQADKTFDKIVEKLKEKGRDGPSAKDIDRLLALAFAYNEKRTQATRLFSAYHKGLDPKDDQRLDEALCRAVMERELAKSLKRYQRNLRDSLADFYNRTYVGRELEPPLTPTNVDFVNLVFGRFVKRASPQVLAGYDLDTFLLGPDSVKPAVWKLMFPPRLRTYGEIVERLYHEMRRPRYRVHPVLFMALMRRESNFDPTAISDVGAAGLTQIMPGTARLLGMSSIYSPSYLHEAGVLLRQARQWRAKALGLIKDVGKGRGREKIEKAYSYMQKAMGLAAKSRALFNKYEKELLRRGEDDRLDAEKAIKHGYTYFTRMLNKYKGDISLALAAYNAGPSRVKQYGGIPPFPETVAFRNMVLRYYYEYLSRLGLSRWGEIEKASRDLER